LRLVKLRFAGRGADGCGSAQLARLDRQDVKTRAQMPYQPNNIRQVDDTIGSRWNVAAGI
jgi:hypothetical protein